MVRDKRRAGVGAKAEAAAEERILDALVGAGSQPATRESFRKKLRAGELDDKEIELTLADTASPMQGLDLPGGNVGMITASITWITPLLAPMSVLTTFAWSTVTAPSRVAIFTVSPLTAFADCSLTTSDAITFPDTT